MSDGPRALLDVERLRALRVPGFGALRAGGSVVVLGSMQPLDDLDATSLERDGVGVARRRGGGGAVLLRPDDCWVELWLPSPLDGVDLRATACDVGAWWATALGSLGIVGAVHRGPVVDADQGAVACFAGLGPGEVTVGDAKLVGLSQWRCREGALISSVVVADPPLDLAAYLVRAATAPRLASATCLSAVAPSVPTTALTSAFEAAARAAHPDLATSPDALR